MSNPAIPHLARDNQGGVGPQAGPDVVPASRRDRRSIARRGRGWDKVLSPPTLTLVAFGTLVIPFAIILVRFLATGSHVYLPDDLALIDLNTRRALAWHQQLGPFDRFGWSHPGPTYFYLLSVAYRVIGSGAQAQFFGATAINALASFGVVWVVKRRVGPAAAVWAAVCVGYLAVQMSFTGGMTTTYSEGALGALVSPWNPTVVVLPMVLFAVLCAGAPAGSPLSLFAALLVGSFIVQTDISAALMVVVFLVASALICVIMAVRRRRHPARVTDGAVPADAADDVVPAVEADGVAMKAAGRGVEGGATGTSGAAHGRWARAWAGLGIVALVAMWLPPLIQQSTNNPGNMTLILRFFTGPQSAASASVANSFRAAMAVYGVLAVGPSEVMSTTVGRIYPYAGVASITAIVLVAAAVVVVAVAVRRRQRFAVMLGGLSLAGGAVTVLAAYSVTGPLYGYLLVWAVAAPLLALIGLGVLVLAPSDRSVTSPTRVVSLRVAVCGLAVVVCAVLSFHATALPSLSSVSDPVVGATVAMVTPELTTSRPVQVVDALGPDLLGTERYIGVVNLLDARGYDPKVSGFFTDLLGQQLLATGHEPTLLTMGRWTASSPSQPGFVGRVGNYAITLTHR